MTDGWGELAVGLKARTIARRLRPRTWPLSINSFERQITSSTESKAASGGGLSHSDRQPLLTRVELRAEYPLRLAIIQKAKQSGAAIIANISDHSLPFVHDAFECLTNHKAHVRPRDRDSLMVVALYSNFSKAASPGMQRPAFMVRCITSRN